MDYKALLPYAKTKKQKLTIKAIIEHGNIPKVALELDIAERTVRHHLQKVKELAAQYDVSPEYKITKRVPEPYIAKGVSTFYDQDGNVSRQWVKADLDKSKQLENIKSWLEDATSDLRQYSLTPTSDFNYKDLMAVYPLGDPHIGMAAYINEAGESWDLAKAKNTYVEMFGRLVQTAPNCKEAVIVNLGDYFHSDNIAGVTTRSGHHLDMDSNYLSMVDIGVEIMVCMIQLALQHHQKVKVINAVGNHDDTGSIFLQVALKHMFAKEPRVTIEVTAGPYNFVTFGKCLFGVHHGHTTKADKLPLVMATDQAKAWGKSKFRAWYTGHIHHDTLKEYSGCTVESFRTLAAKDAYATWGGYRSDRDSKAIVLHKEFGEVERHTVNIVQMGKADESQI